jgi:hypothetical protein
LQSIFSFKCLRTHILLRRADVLYQAKTVAPVCAVVLHDVHALLNEMQTESSRPYFSQGAEAHLLRIYSWPAIAQHNFQPYGRFRIGLPLNRAEKHLNGLVRSAAVRVSYDIREHFVDSTRDRPAVCRGKSE